MLRALWLAQIALLTLGGCAGPVAEADPPFVMATTTIVGDLTARVVGDEAVVEVLMPVGADPCGYEPTTEQARRLLQADLVVSSGLGLEAGLDDALTDAERRGVRVLRLGDELYPRHLGNDAREALDPYWWMDPLRAAGAVSLIAERLIWIRDGDWLMRAFEAKKILCALDDEIRDLLRRCEPGPRHLITSRDGLGYFAGRYDCIITDPDLVPVTPLGPSSVTEVPTRSHPLPEGGVSRVRVIEPTGQGVSLTDPFGLGGRRAEMVALFIDSVGGPGSGAETYEDMMLTNADRIAHAGSSVLVEPAHADTWPIGRVGG